MGGPPGPAVAGEGPAQVIELGAADSVAAAPGSPGALYRYRFEMTLPGSARFNFQDRDLSFYFRPAPSALYFQVENRQARPVWIDWERSTFYDPYGRRDQVAHSTTKWADRFNAQPPTQIAGLQRYSDYVLPLGFLLDPAGRPEQLHRPLLPEDATAPQFSDASFGVDLVFMIEDQPRPYSFRFRVASIIPTR